MALPLRRNAHFAMMISEGRLGRAMSIVFATPPTRNAHFGSIPAHLHPACDALAAHLRRTWGVQNHSQPGGEGWLLISSMDQVIGERQYK